MRKKDLLLVSVASLMLFTGLFSVKAVSYVEGGVSISQEYDILLQTDITNPYYEPGNNGYTDLTQPYKVTDSSHLNSSQPVVTVDLTDFGLTTGAIYNGGFSTLVFVFQLDLKEIDDGYQEFYVFDPVATNKPNFVTPITSFDHGGSGANTSYSRYEFYAEIPRTALTSQYVAIGFSANGWGSDDWVFKNLKVQILTSSQNRNYTNLWWVENPYYLFNNNEII